MSKIAPSAIEQYADLLLLTPDDRANALRNAAQLACLSNLANKVNDWIPSGITRLAIYCADACREHKENNPWQPDNFQRFACCGTGKHDDVLVLAVSENSEDLADVCAVADALGAGGFQPTNPEQLAAFLDTLNQARDLIDSLPKSQEVVRLNTGLIVPYRCKPPSVGSGSALQMPGALLLPAGVPAVVLAECWIHESLHTELHLAEWFEGVPPASAATNLPTPWRTVERPAALLLHGAYVFSSLLSFIDAMRELYSQVSSEWHLSATRGTQIPIKNVQEVIAFRKRQILEALQKLDQAASYTQYGKKTMTLIRQQLSIS
jgi:HEXXH motif-containing protein